MRDTCTKLKKSHKKVQNRIYFFFDGEMNQNKSDLRQKHFYFNKDSQFQHFKSNLEIALLL
jgi:hypothetical protein